MNIVYSFIKNNPEKLLNFFYSRKNSEDKDLVIERLKEIDAIDELFSIREERPDNIYPFLIEKLKNNKDKLIILYQIENNDYKLKIIRHLINCNAVNELWKIKDTNRDIIYPFLINIYEENEEKLIQLYHVEKNEYKNKIIDNLKKIEATASLRRIKNDSPDKIYPYLFQQFKGYDDKLMKIALDNPIAFFSAKESSYSFNEFLSENHHFLLFISEFPLMIKEVFMRSSDRIKLYLLLIYYERLNLKFSPIAPYYNIGSDCYKENIKDFSSNFENYMNKALEGFEINDYILAYLSNNEAFKNKINNIKKKKTIVIDYDKEIRAIKYKYLHKKKNAISKQEIESLLKQENNEIDLVFVQRKFTILRSVINNNQKLHSSRDLSNAIVSQLENKNKINLETITIDHKLTDNYQADKKKIDSELESIILNIEDANDIMKAKAQAKKELNLLIDTEDFCFTLQTSNYQLANNDKIINVLGKFLTRYEDMTIRKAIIQFASRSTNIYWLKYLEQIIDTDKSCLFEDHYLQFLSNNISSKNLKLLFMMYELEYKVTKIDNSFFNKGEILTGNSKYILYNKEYKLFQLITYDFEVISSYQSEEDNYKAAFSPDGQYILVLKEDFYLDGKYIYPYGFEIKLFSVPNMTVLGSYVVPRIIIKRDHSRTAHFSPDGQYILVQQYRELKLLSVPNMTVLGSYQSEGEIETVHFSPDGQYILKHLLYRELELLSIPDMTVLGSYQSGGIETVHFSPDGQYILVQLYIKLKLLSVPNMTVLGSSEPKKEIKTAHFSPDGQYILVKGDYEIKLLSVPNMTVLGSYQSEEEIIVTAHFSPDGQYILVKGDYEIKLFSVPNMTVLGSYQSEEEIVTAHFSPDGQYILVKGDYEYLSGYKLKLLSIPDMTVLGSYQSEEEIVTAHFSPDGYYIFGKCKNGLYNIYVHFYPIMLEILEHLLYLYYFANKDDILNLIELKSNVGKTYQPSQRVALINIIDRIIEKAGKESKTISLNQEQRADSKDIFVNKD